GNAIGTRADGSLAFNAMGSGIIIEYGARANTVGGVEPGAGNTIAANAAAGVLIGHAAADNAVLGNALGSIGQSPGNGVGVLIQTGAARNLVQDNRVGGNVFGVVLNPTASRNLILGNVIGASSGDGTDGNLDVGLILRDAPDN